MRIGKTYYINAPQILKGLRLIGVENGAQYMALTDADIIRMMKGKGLNAYQRNYILRRKRWCRSEGWTVEFGDQEKQPPPPVILRDHFAGLAMQGHYHAAYAYDGPKEVRDTACSPLTLQSIAEASYAMADAMLKARDQQ